MRKKNRLVYDVQRELREVVDEVSINAVILKEEDFARLPRRKDDERPDVVKPEPEPIADVQALDLSPRSFGTRVAGLFFFVPLMQQIDVGELARAVALIRFREHSCILNCSDTGVCTITSCSSSCPMSCGGADTCSNSCDIMAACPTTP